MGCPAIFSLQRLNLVPRGLYHIIEHTVSMEFWAIFPEFRKLSPRKLDEKADTLHCEGMETIFRFRKNMMAKPSFYYQKE